MDCSSYVSLPFFQWSMGLLITSVTGALIVFAKRLFQTPTREEMTRDMEDLSSEKEREHDAILRQIEQLQINHKDSLLAIREAVSRLEAGYFVRFNKTPGDRNG